MPGNVPRRQSTTGCNHTLHIQDDMGQPQGSWVEERTRDGVRVVCGNCGRFYGYLRNSATNLRRQM